jgi:hypothetical protein
VLDSKYQDLFARVLRNGHRLDRKEKYSTGGKYEEDIDVHDFNQRAQRSGLGQDAG